MRIFKLISAQSTARIVLMLFFVIFFIGSILSDYVIGIFGVSNSYDLKRILVIAFVMATTVFLSWGRSVQVVIPSNFTCVTLGTILIFGIISALYSQHPFWSMLELANFLLLICLFFILSSCIAVMGRTEVLRYFFGFALFFTLCISTKFFLFLLFHFIEESRPNLHSLVSGFMNVRFFNQLQILLVPLLCLSFYMEELKKFRFLAMLAFSFLWLILLQSEARGAVLAIMVSAFLVYCFLPISARKHFIRPLLTAIAMGTGLWLVLIVILPLFIFDNDIWQLRVDSSGRIAMWLYILQEIPQRIFMGYGPMGFAWAEGKPLLNAHPHNALLQFLYEYGIGVFVVVTVWSVLKLTALFGRLKQTQRVNPNTVIIFALCSAWIYSLFDGMIVMPLSQALLVALLAINCQYSKVITVHTQLRLGATLGVLLLGTVLISSFEHPELTQSMYPRLWLMGLVNN